MSSATDPSNDPHVKRAQKEAEEISRDPSKLDDLSTRAKKKAERLDVKYTSKLGELRVLVRMVKAYATGAYREIPWSTLTKFVGGLLYFVWAIDIIPDFIAGLGFLDDLTVIHWIIQSAKVDVDRFKEWEKSNPSDE